MKTIKYIYVAVPIMIRTNVFALLNPIFTTTSTELIELWLLPAWIFFHACRLSRT